MGNEFGLRLKAGFPAIWVQTHEERRAMSVLAAQSVGYAVFEWDMISGLLEHATGTRKQVTDPIGAVQEILNLPNESLLFLKDFHKFLGNIQVTRMLKTVLPAAKSTNRHIVILSPVLQIPVELEKDIVIVPFELPGVEELVKVAQDLVAENGLDISADPAVICVARGLTLEEAENAMAMSLVKDQAFSKSILENEKLLAVRKSGLLELYKPVPESQLGGLQALKDYVHRRKDAFGNGASPARPRGIMLVGLPGGGKSLSAKVIASILDVPLLRLDIAGLKGSLVGESESKMRQALALIDAVSPCVVWIDEIEKHLTGVQSSGRSDGGTTAAMFGYLLTWMQESESPKYVVATCNDIEDILTLSQGALIRRFDDIFFVDLPNAGERLDILAIMNARYGTSIKADLSARMDGWTGAEIEKFVVASLYDGIREAFSAVKPIFRQNRERIEQAREWARHNARMAGPMAGPVEHVKSTGKRKIVQIPPPSDNADWN